MTTVDQLVVQLLGVEPVRVQRTGSPDAWYVDLPGDRRVVVKRPGWLNRPGSPRVEAWAYGECRRRGIRVPDVLALSEDPECLIIERLCGQSLAAGRDTMPMTAADRAAWACAGEDLRALHQIRMPGFGPLVPGPERPTGEASTWCPFADYACAEGIPWLVDAGFLEPAAAGTLIRLYEDAAPAFNRVSEGRLLHGDLMTSHVFRSPDGTYQGIIDFGQAQAGDPRWDLARIPLWDGERALSATTGPTTSGPSSTGPDIAYSPLAARRGGMARD